MEQKLLFDENVFDVEELYAEGTGIKYRAYKNIVYVRNPVDEIQKLSIFVPEKYYHGESINGYSLKTAPIFMPNTVGGYKPGPSSKPMINEAGKPNTIFRALEHGYVVVSAGVRGRGSLDKEEKSIGTAPAVVCDMKAAVRFLRYYADKIPGNVERIITNGTSAGGALSSLMGTTGNHPDYVPYLREMGAAETSDAVYAASCYCPITNLENADMAYEWEFGGIREYYGWKAQGEMSDKQMELSKQLAVQFPNYINKLNLRDKENQLLKLDKKGEGSFQKEVERVVVAAACKAEEEGTDLSEFTWIIRKEKTIIGVDFKEYIKYRTRMKTTPAFDNISMGTAENELFGTESVKNCHFTKFSYDNSEVCGEMARENRIRMMNPMNYIEDDSAVKASYFRIRHGAVDRDTSLAIPVVLHTKLLNSGIASDLHLPWGIAHAGDYDLEELFNWIDENV